MFITVFLSTLLVMNGLGRAAASDLQVYGKSSYNDKTLSSDSGRHTARKQPQQQIKSEIRRSLDLKSFNVHMTPPTSKINLPTIIKLYPPTAKPLHLHANMPMRFGRENNPGDDRTPNSTPNMPQRFGRSWEVTQQPHRLGRCSLYWGLLRTLANGQLLNAGLHWAEDFDFTTSTEVMKIQEKNL